MLFRIIATLAFLFNTHSFLVPVLRLRLVYPMRGRHHVDVWVPAATKACSFSIPDRSLSACIIYLGCMLGIFDPDLSVSFLPILQVDISTLFRIVVART